MITEKGSDLDTLIEGGTGTNSESLQQPPTMPDRMESGTPNMPGISGLRAGIEFVSFKGIDRIYRHEMSILQSLYQGLTETKGVLLYTPEPSAPHFVPVLSFNVEGIESEAVAKKLANAGIAVRAGLHCAPEAHKFMGTLEQGAVRVAPSAFSTQMEVRQFLQVLRKNL